MADNPSVICCANATSLYTREALAAAAGHGAWCAGVLVIAVGLYGAALILFTLAPPELPVFIG